jgi:hypothetical protein
VVLLCGNCSSYIDDEIKEMLALANVRLVTFPPQPSNLSQPLGLVAFSVFKREKRESTVKLSEGSQVSQITKLMKVLESAADSSNNRSAFKRASRLTNPRIFPRLLWFIAAPWGQ